VTPSARALWWHYLLGSLFTAHCGITSARNGALWYAAGLFAVSLLLLVALAREYIADDERRAAATRAERAARLRQPRPAIDGVVAVALAGACCEAWWTSAGAGHEATCTNQRRTA
jgi:membrane protein implicated in regulation of membrane protease activity